MSIQYHALKGAQVYDQLLKDAKRAQTCHELLTEITKDGGIAADAYPTDTKQTAKV